jgi:hypothetical protein
MNQFPKFTPRTFSPVEKAGEFDPGSVYQTKFDARDGVAAIKVANAAIEVVFIMAVLSYSIKFCAVYHSEDSDQQQRTNEKVS